jgi:hypothetical protein
MYIILTNTIIDDVHHSTTAETGDAGELLFFPNFERARKYAIQLFEDSLENVFGDNASWTADIHTIPEQDCVAVTISGNSILYTITIQEVNV